MSRKPSSGRQGKQEAAGQSKRIVPPPPAGPPLMPRSFDVHDLQDLPVTVEIVATSAECAALASTFGIPAIASLSSRLELRKQARIVTVTGPHARAGDAGLRGHARAFRERHRG